MTVCQWETFSAEETRRLGESIASTLEAGTVCLLQGAMGCGKTVFVQGIAAGLGIDPRQIRSPTFTIVHEHQGSVCDLLHLDLYRLAAEDFDSLGLDELMAGPAIKAIEWADHLPSPYHRGRWFLFERLQDCGRRIREARQPAPPAGRPVLPAHPLGRGD